MNEQKISDLIIIQLINELPEEFQEKIDEFKELVKLENYRAAFNILDELKRIKGWATSSKLLSYFERFWWEQAN